MAIPLVQNKDTGLVVRSIINELVNYANNSTVTGSFKVTGSSDITGDLRVDGSTYFTGSVYISGSNTLFNTGPATFSGSLTQGMGPFFVSKFAHAEGFRTSASGDYSHAEGYQTIASGSYSHAEGNNTQALGSTSHAEGIGTSAAGIGQHVQGRYNITSSTPSAFIIGNGESNSTRSNLVFAAGEDFQITGSLRVTGSAYIQGLDNTTQNSVITYNSSTGQLFYTSSTAFGGGGGNTPPGGIDTEIQFSC